MTAPGTDKLTTNAVKASHISLLFCPSVFTHLPPLLDPHCIYPPFTPGFQSTAWECETFTCQTKRQRNRDFKGHIALFTSKISRSMLAAPCWQQKNSLICPVLITSVKKQFCRPAKPALLSVQTTGQRRHHLSKSQQLVLKHDLMCKHL